MILTVFLKKTPQGPLTLGISIHPLSRGLYIHDTRDNYLWTHKMLSHIRFEPKTLSVVNVVIIDSLR